MLHPDLTGLAADASHRLEIVDQAGHAVWQGAFRAGASRDPGPGAQRRLYFVRVYLPAGGLRREYGLEIQLKESGISTHASQLFCGCFQSPHENSQARKLSKIMIIGLVGISVVIGDLGLKL